MQMMAFAIACEGASIEAMKSAVKAYVQGRVKRDNHTFAPSAAEFAEEVRRQQAIMDMANRPRIEKPKEVEFSEEHRERMLGRMEVLAKAIGGSLKAREELEGILGRKLEFADIKPLDMGAAE